MHQIEQDIWTWLREFVTVPHEFYHQKFPPCPYARAALLAQAVDVVVWQQGHPFLYIRQNAIEMRDMPTLTTRVMAFPPRTQWTWGITEYVEALNAELIPDNLFLNTGLAKTTVSRYPGSTNDPYFIVVVNSLDAVLKGAESLRRSSYYQDWPRSHYELVVERRARMAKRYGKKLGA